MYRKRFDVKHFDSGVDCFSTWCDVKCISSVPVEEGPYWIGNINTAKAFASFLHDQFYSDGRSVMYLALYFLMELMRNTIFNACILIFVSKQLQRRRICTCIMLTTSLFFFPYLSQFEQHTAGIFCIQWADLREPILFIPNNLMKIYCVLNSSHWFYFFFFLKANSVEFLWKPRYVSLNTSKILFFKKDVSFIDALPSVCIHFCIYWCFVVCVYIFLLVISVTTLNCSAKPKAIKPALTPFRASEDQKLTHFIFLLNSSAEACRTVFVSVL